MPKHEFIAVDDHRMGGIWCLIHANSPDEITRKYPELTVVEQRPLWINDSEYRQIAARHTYDIDEPARGYLVTLVANRK